MITADSILEIFKYAGSLKLFGISLLKYLAFLLTFFSILLTKGLFRNLIKKKISLFFPKKDKDFLATFNKPINFLIFSIAFFISTVFLKDSVFIKNFINKINASLFTIIIFWAISKLIQPLFFRIKNIENIFTKDLLEWIISALKVILFILGFSAVLEIWGIKVAPIIAGLGLFGVAVALGAQDLFKNLISGVLVLVEKRFKKGDVIVIDGIIEGVVEKIGFRSTAIRRFDKSLCFIPNNQFAENAVTNISKISNRRINWLIGLEYKSSTKQLKSVCSDIEKKITSNSKDFFITTNTPVIVKINEFSASSIDILVRCFANTNEYEEFLIIKDRLAISIKEIVEKRGCSFAFPSQSLYIEKN